MILIRTKQHQPLRDPPPSPPPPPPDPINAVTRIHAPCTQMLLLRGGNKEVISSAIRPDIGIKGGGRPGMNGASQFLREEEEG